MMCELMENPQGALFSVSGRYSHPTHLAVKCKHEVPNVRYITLQGKKSVNKGQVSTPIKAPN